MPELSSVFCLHLDRVHAEEGFSQETDTSDDVSETLLTRCTCSFLLKITVFACLTVLATQPKALCAKRPNDQEIKSAAGYLFCTHSLCTVCDLLAHEPTQKQSYAVK